jgi:hypothetical protein
LQITNKSAFGDVREEYNLLEAIVADKKMAGEGFLEMVRRHLERADNPAKADPGA